MNIGGRYVSFLGHDVYFRVDIPDGEIARRVLIVSSPEDDTDSWQPLLDRLMGGNCLCVTVDLPGFGRSSCGANVRQDNNSRASILWGILDLVERDFHEERVCCWHLMAHGSAAGAILTMAVLQPDSVLSLAMISPVLGNVASPLVRALMGKSTGEALIDKWYRKTILDPARFRDAMNESYGLRLPPQVLRRLHQPFLRRGFIRQVPNLIADGYHIAPEAFRGFTPIILFWGGRDRRFGGEIPESVQKLLPTAEKHNIRSAAHCAMYTHADILWDYLRGWYKYVENE